MASLPVTAGQGDDSNEQAIRRGVSYRRPHPAARVSEPEPGPDAGTFRRTGPPTMTDAQRKASVIAALILLIAGTLTLKGFLPALAWAAIFAIALWPVIEWLDARFPGTAACCCPRC